MSDAVAGASQDDLLSAAEGVPLTVRASAARSIPVALQSGRIAPAHALAWASFVRRGYLAGGSGPVRPIAVEHETEADDVIVEVIARLDQIGDQVDGTPPTADELDAMIASLDSAS
jgi:hypothetical protein